MKIELSHTRRIALGFTTGLLILIFVGIVSIHSTREFIRSALVTAQSHHVMTAIENLLEDTASAESEARGYVITGREPYLARYKQSMSEVEGDFQDLRNCVIDATGRQRLEKLEQLTQQRLERLRQTVETRKLEGLEAVMNISGPGKLLMESIRQVVASFNAQEQRLLTTRDEQTRTLGRQTILVVILGSLFAIVLTAVSTMVLMADMAHRERLEREVLDISEREQRRIGQDLHDGVCQHLTGIALLCRSHQQRLEAMAPSEAPGAERITNLINEGIEQTRCVTHGLHPVENDPSGLMEALQELANGVHAAAQLACRFECREPVLIPDQLTATHLYRIAQEAVQNAIRHAQPTTITIQLVAGEAAITLTVTDDGRGLPAQRTKRGLGLEIMNYRAHTLGAKLTIERGTERGMVVRCVLPRNALT
jgi:signal transduction histidine kinase